jgi:hypothetical protein
MSGSETFASTRIIFLDLHALAFDTASTVSKVYLLDIACLGILDIYLRLLYISSHGLVEFYLAALILCFLHGGLRYIMGSGKCKVSHGPFDGKLFGQMVIIVIFN